MASTSLLRRSLAPRLPALRWPLPALLAWAAGWVATLVLLRSGALPPALAVATGIGVAALPALFATTFWRRVIVAAGFPVSLLATGVGGALPAWAWLLPLAALALAYPVTAWSDAPVFPTPRDALAGLDRHIALAPGASLLDAGCGLGHGLQALRAVWPMARVAGVEWSWPLTLATKLRCPWARVARGDMCGPPPRPGLSVPAAREHGPRAREGGRRDAAGQLGRQPRIRSRRPSAACPDGDALGASDLDLPGRAVTRCRCNHDLPKQTRPWRAIATSIPLISPRSRPQGAHRTSR
jgi:hypothetical protein